MITVKSDDPYVEPHHAFTALYSNCPSTIVFFLSYRYLVGRTPKFFAWNARAPSAKNCWEKTLELARTVQIVVGEKYIPGKVYMYCYVIV